MTNKIMIPLLVVLAFGALLLAACGGGAEPVDDHDNTEDAHMEAPPEFADLTNPFAGDH